MTNDKEHPGLGKVIYSVDNPKEPAKPSQETNKNVNVQEASEESFPASDAPGFSGSSSTADDCRPKTS